MDYDFIRTTIEGADKPQLTAARLIADCDEVDDALICEVMQVERLGDIPARRGERRRSDAVPPSVRHRALARVRLGESPKAVAAALGVGHSTVTLWLRKAGIRLRQPRKGGM